MQSQLPGESKWAAKEAGGQASEADRQGVKGGWFRVEERASDPRSPSLLATFPAPLESGKTHPVCLRVGKMAFFF